MPSAVTTETGKSIARPLKVLVPLIRDDLRHGDDAAQTAGMPHYRAAGQKLNEARGQQSAAEFWGWSTRNFKRGKSQLAFYMQLDASVAVTKQDFASIKDFRRRHLGHDVPTSGGSMRQPSWQEPVRQIMGRVDLDTLRDAELKRADEREAERKLALQLVDIGYKTLATKLHPDKGGSRDAMARLNRVRDRLKAHA
jgi:hypothetical protein